MAIPAYYSLIQRGSSGPDVALVQTWLNGIRDSCTWHAALTVDGKFGANTEKAVREFQLRYGLKEDGKVGANTWNVLYARYTAKHGLTVPYPGIVLRSGSAGGCVRLVQQKLNTEGMLEGLKAGKQVNFGDLGAFRLQINSGGAPSADLFTSDYIKGVNIQFVPGEELQVIFQGLKFNLVPTRAAQAAVIKAQKAGKTTVDISGKNGSSDSESPDEI